MIAERKQAQDEVISHPRYTVGEVLGRGSWGTVYEANDNATGETVALKVLNPTPAAREKMKTRKLTPFGAMRNEGDLAACANVVPRSFEVDSQGTPFIRMPIYHAFLKDKLGDDEGQWRKSVGRGLEYSDAVGYLEGIARGIGEMHTVRNRAHADIKPDNVAIDGKIALLNDLGSSTCVSLGWAQSQQRDNSGFFFTRAPEQFKDDGHPDRQSDIWSFGALAYRMFTGEYPLEQELRTAQNPRLLLEQLGTEGVDLIVKRKIKANFPREHRRLGKLVERCLSASTYKRPYDGNSLVEELESAIHDSVPKEAWRAFKRLGAWTAAATIAGTALVGTTFLRYTEDSLRAPPAKVKGMLYIDEKPIAQGGVFFDAEQINDLPQTMHGMLNAGTTSHAKASTPDRNAAYLVDCYAKTLLNGGSMGGVDIKREYRKDALEALAKENGKKPDENTFYAVVAKSLEKTIGEMRESNGRVDLEDVCAITLIGPEKLAEAKRAVGSESFVNYIDAKTPDGKYIIQKTHREFLKTWLAYIHDG